MATQKRNALGRGLDALLSMDDVKTEGSSSIRVGEDYRQPQSATPRIRSNGIAGTG